MQLAKLHSYAIQNKITHSTFKMYMENVCWNAYACALCKIYFTLVITQSTCIFYHV